MPENHLASPFHILLLEDHTSLAEELIYFLEQRGFLITHTQNLEQTLAVIQAEKFDLMLLDRLVTDGDSIEILTQCREYQTAYIVMMTALGQTHERIDGLNAGADYYLTKPVDIDELLAIIEVFIRRQNLKPKWQLAAHDLITPNDITIPLTGTELKLLTLLIDNKNQAVERNKIVEHFGLNPDDYDLRRMDTALYRLRQKITKADPQANLPIKTLSRQGYIWSE